MLSCSACKQVKPKEEFGKNTTNTRGHQYHCKPCRKLEKEKRDYKKEYKSAVVSGRRETEREVRKEYAKQIRQSYPWKKRHYEAIRRARKKSATPKWACLETIKLIYKNCPVGYEVDHIIPLLGKTVSGLHVPENLQYLLKSENRIKSNKVADCA